MNQKPPTFIPTENSKATIKPINSEERKALRLNNQSHMIHPESDWEVYPKGELDLEKEVEKIKRASDSVEEHADKSVDLDLSLIKEEGSEKEMKKALSNTYKSLSNILIKSIQESEEEEKKKDALGGVS